MFEQQQVLGHVGRDPEMRFTPTGQMVTNFPVAVTRYIPQQDAEAKKLTVWYKIITWGKLAESCNKYLNKGRAVLVVGVPEVDTKTGQVKVWTDKDGNPRASLGIVASTVRFIGKGGDANGTGSETDNVDALESIEEMDIPRDDNESFEDIPF